MAVPDDTPVTIPVDEPTVATDPLLLLHAPPEVVSFKFIAAPTQAGLEPVMPDSGLTVTVCVRKQPVPNV